MSKFWLITKVQLKEIFDLRKMKDNKRKTMSFGAFLLLIIILYSFLSFVYNFSFYYIFKSCDILEYYPVMVFSIASIMTLFTSIIKAKGLIFGSKDYDILMSLPVSTFTIVASKIFLLYIYELIFTFIIFLPCVVFYGMSNPIFFALGIPILLLTPGIPICIASFLAFCISFISEKLKFKSIIQAVLTLGFIVGIMFLSSTISSSTSSSSQGEQAFDPKAYLALANGLKKAYPLSYLFLDGCIRLKPLYLFLFFFISLFGMFIFTFIIGKGYKRISQFIFSVKSHSKYKNKSLGTSSQLKALLKKEAKQFFGSPSYMVNSLSGALVAIVLAFMFGLNNKAFASGSEGADIIYFFQLYSPLIICFGLGMNCLTSATISFEGKNYWIIKSSPIDYRTYLKSKLLINFIVLAPFAIIASVLFTVFLKMSNPLFIISVFVTPLLFIYLVGCIDLIVNLKHPKMEWSNENAALKNSSSVLISMLFGLLLIIPLAIIVTIFSFINKYLMLGVIIVFLLIGIIISAKYLMKNATRLVMRVN